MVRDAWNTGRAVLALAAGVALVLALGGCTSLVTSQEGSVTGGGELYAMAGGFDEFGYNYDARIFVGLADGVDRVLDGKVWGDPTYANDRLVMKWSKAWDDARFNGAPWTPEAWCTNERNGRVPGGSGEVWHYKFIWVGPELEDSPY